MASRDPGQVAAQLLRHCQYVNIATTSGEGPWNTPVTVVADAALMLYWSSWSGAQHSRNLRDDARVFLTLYDSTRARGTNHMGCLYLRGTAREVTRQDEGAKAFRLIYPGQPVQLDDFFDAGPKRFYAATVDAAWLNDLSEREVTPRTVKMRMAVPLDALRAAWAPLAAE